MSAEWTLWEKLLLNGDATTDERQNDIDESVANLIDGLANDPTYQADATIGGTTVPMAVARKSALISKIKAVPGSAVAIGDVVHVLGGDWLCVDIYVDALGFVNGEIWLCNASIAFQNRSTTILTKPCVIDDGSYSKLSASKGIIVLSTEYKLYISGDADTEKLYVGKRLAVGKAYNADGVEELEVYQISGIDKKTRNFGTYSHLLTMPLQRDVYSAERDDITTMVCDIYTGSDPAPISTCEIVGSDVIRVGTSRSYTAAFYDNGELTPHVPVWNVAAPAGITYTVVDDIVTVTVPFAADFVGTTIVLTVFATDDESLMATKNVGVIRIG